MEDVVGKLIEEHLSHEQNTGRTSGEQIAWEQRKKHLLALQSFINKVKGDPNIIALLLSGSLSYGTVWKRSDIDMNILVRDGSIPKAFPINLDENGVEIHAEVLEVKTFKLEMQQNRAGMFIHGYYGKSQFVFTKDDSLIPMFEENKTIGRDDVSISLLHVVQELLVDIYRAEKWVTVFDDPLYSQRFLHQCALSASAIILLMNKEVNTREAILRARELRPELMEQLYVLPSTTYMTREQVFHVLKLLDNLIYETMEIWSKPVLRFYEEGEVKSSSEFGKLMGDQFPYCLNYMAEHGLLERVTKECRIFKHSMLTLDELAYVATPKI